MARPRKFDEEGALDAAMREFWHRGYEATSTDDLCDATGLGRGSIYNTFTSKHALFERSLERYVRFRGDELAELLETPGVGTKERIGALFRSILQDEALSDGCLVTNTLIEVAPRDPEIAARLRADYRDRVATVRTALEAGQRAGEIGSDTSAEELAHMVLGTVTAMRVMARGGADRAALESMADGTLRAL